MDQRTHHLTPGSVGRLAAIDSYRSRPSDFLILQQRELEGEYGGRLLVRDLLGKLAQRTTRGRYRLGDCLAFR
jgi:hypothetical protein